MKHFELQKCYYEPLCGMGARTDGEGNGNQTKRDGTGNYALVMEIRGMECKRTKKAFYTFLYEIIHKIDIFPGYNK